MRNFNGLAAVPAAWAFAAAAAPSEAPAAGGRRGADPRRADNVRD